MKMTVNEIRERFDNDVQRFTNLETGQTATVDSAMVIEMIAKSAAVTNPKAQSIFDIGCGAGNFTLKILQKLPGLRCSILDLSKPMLDKAQERIIEAAGTIESVFQKDIREAEIGEKTFDIITAAAVLHHLRTRDEWRAVLTKIFKALKPGGSFWYWDLVKHEIPGVHHVQEDRYKAYLINQQDEHYQQHVFEYIEKEDTPETPTFIMTELINAGFSKVDIIHKNSNFAAIAGIK